MATTTPPSTRSPHPLRHLVAAAGACTIVVTALAAAAAAGSAVRPTGVSDSVAAPHATRARTTVAATLSGRARRYSYGWPVKPFDRQHPVRGFFGDPREARDGSRSFHFGIDVCAPDGTPVYAVEAGTVRGLRGRSLNVIGPRGRAFAYWHIVPAVREGQHIRLHQLVGHVEAPWAHVHFAEVADGRWVNPLRPEALGPYGDATAPNVTRLWIARNAQRKTELIVDAFDTTPLRAAAPWTDMPVTPALIRWRLVGVTGTTAWRTSVDARLHIPNNDRFWEFYAPGTRKNDPPRPGRYCFRVVCWNGASIPRSGFVQVSVEDAAGNRAVATLPLAG